jgi:hypothetical protein
MARVGRRLWRAGALALALCGGAGLAAPVAEAGDVVLRHDPLGGSIVAEASAMGAVLARAIAVAPVAPSASASGAASIPAQDAVDGWSLVTALAGDLQFGAALREARHLRPKLEAWVRSAALEHPGEEWGRLVDAWIDALAARGKALGSQMEQYTPTPRAREAALVAPAHVADAAKALKAKDVDLALRLGFQAAALMDLAVEETYPASRDP